VIVFLHPEAEACDKNVSLTVKFFACSYRPFQLQRYTVTEIEFSFNNNLTGAIQPEIGTFSNLRKFSLRLRQSVQKQKDFCLCTLCILQLGLCNALLTSF
jgi:hypothetical protein